MSPLLRPRTLLGVVVAASLCYVSVAGGQGFTVAVTPGMKKKGKDGKEDRDWNEPITLPVERAAKDKIDAVNKYVTGKEPVTEKIWGDIISVVQAMLDDPADKFVEIDGKGNKVSIKLEVNRIIGTFNKDGLEFYQRNVGPTAESRYKQAQDENDMAMMGEVASRYLHTKAGAAAAIRVGTWHLDRGRYMQAEKSLRSLTLRDPKNELSPELLYKAALAMKRAGQTADAAAYWEKLEKATNKAAVNMNGKQVDFEKLKAEYEKATPQVALFTSEHGLFRRDPTNNGVGAGTTPFLEPKFRYEFANPVDDIHYESKKGGFEALKDRVDKALKLLETKGMAPIPGSFPLASNGKVIFRGYDGVYCVATREDKSVDPPIKPGELLWKSETDGGLLQMFKDIGPRTLADQWLGMYTGSGPHGILIENPLLGTLSHDGRVVYVVDDLALPPHPQQWSQAQFNGGYQPRFGVFDDAVNHSRLKAIDIETGKLLWKVGERVNQNPQVMNPGFGGGPVAIDDTGRPVPPKKDVAPPPPAVKETTETLLADCFFLGPPLPLAGKLYCVIEKDGDLKLVCLDPSRLEKSTRADKRELMPTLVWSQALGQPNGKLPQDAFRRFQAVHLAYADGILVVPTNAGAVLGIDLFSHSLIWAASYKSNKTNKQPVMDEEMQFRRRGGMPAQNQALAYETSRERWHASAPIIHNGKVIFTAFDSDTVECVDLQEGRSVWKSPITRQDGDQYVAGVFDDKVMVVGRGSVRFHNVATGAQMKDALPTGVPTGVGVATAGTYFLPIKAAKDKSNEPGIVAIDTKAMAIKGTSRSRKRETAGNLLFYENDVYSLTPTGLSSFPQLAAKIKDTETKLAANANDPEGLLDLAMLQHDDGRLSPAIGNYRKALENKPADAVRSKAREKLFEAITELLQSDFNAGEPMLAEYRTLCEVTIPADATEAQKALLAEEELRRKSNYFCLVAKGKEAQGKLVDAFDNYMQFGTLVGNKEMVSVIDEPNTFARPDVWARGRISSMVKKATPEQRKPLEDKVVAEWAKVKGANDLEALRGFVKVFGGLFDAGTDAKIALADRLSAAGGEDDAREAEYMLLSLRGADDDPSGAAKATEALARLYIRKGLLDDAVGMYAELGNKHKEAVVRDGKTGAQVYSELVTDKRFLPYLEPMTVKWPFPKMGRGTDTTGGGGVRNVTEIDPGPEALPFFRRYRLVMDTNARGGQGFGLKVFDRVTNQEYWSSPGVGYPTQHQGFFTQAGMPMRLVQVKGHVAVVTIHDNHQQTGMPRARAFAFDVAEKKKLWEIDLFGTGPTATANTAQVSQVMEADGLRITYQDGWSAKVGQQWVVEAAYTLLLTRDGLVAKDNARGTVLWTKSNVSPRTNMIGDGQHVFLYDCAPDGSTSPVRCFRAADGVEVPVPDSSVAFPTVKGTKVYGRRVLAFDTDAGKKAVRLYDLLTGKDVWKREVGGDGWPLRSEDDAFAGFVTAAGDVVVLDALTGKDVFKSKLELRKPGHMEKLTDAMLLSDADRFFVVLNRTLENKNPFGMQQVFAQQINAVRASGAMYAFNRADGKRLWATDELEDMYVVTDQFAELPIILSAGYWQKAAANGGIVSQEMKTVGIDKATGRMLYYKVGMAQGAYYSLLSDPKTGSIELINYSGQRVKFAPAGTTVSSADPKGPEKDGNIRANVAMPAIRVVPLPVKK